MSGTITGTLTFTPQADWVPDENFPTGYSYYSTIYGSGYQTFDFERNRYYALINDTVPTIGILIVDLSAMNSGTTVTLAQMYAGTAYGSPPGTHRAGSVWDITTGNGTDIYLLIGPDKATPFFVRVDATTFKVTGEFTGAHHDPNSGVANRTTNHTILAYHPHAVWNLGPEIFDGTGMTLLGIAATPGGYGTAYVPAGGTRPDGSCDFVMIKWDYPTDPTDGLIHIWRVNVSDSLVITTTNTGTFDATSVYDPNAGTTAWIGQWNYDAANDAIIFWMQQQINGGSQGTWLTSVNWDGSVNWSTHLPTVGTTWANRGQAQLTGDTLMVGAMSDPIIVDTDTGDVIYTGTVSSPPGVGGGYFYHVWDAARSSYWTYQLATYGFSRLDFIADALPLLAMDDVVCTIEPDLSQNLVSLRWSDDGGHSYGHAVSQSIGEIGEYLTSLQWQRLGMCRDRNFEIFWSVPMPTALLGAWIEVTPAES